MRFFSSVGYEERPCCSGFISGMIVVFFINFILVFRPRSFSLISLLSEIIFHFVSSFCFFSVTMFSKLIINILYIYALVYLY